MTVQQLKIIEYHTTILLFHDIYQSILPGKSNINQHKYKHGALGKKYI